MIKDKDLEMSLAQAITTDAASTDYIDQGAAGDAIRSGFLVVRCDTTFDSANDTATLLVKLQSDSDAGFATALVTHYTSDSLTVGSAALTAGGMLKIPLPVGLKRYIRVYYDNGTEAFNAGKLDAFIVKDVDQA